MENNAHDEKLKLANLKDMSNKEIRLKICLSEFIDNTIQNYENNHKDISECKIKINYYEENDQTYIEIIDNAFGILDWTRALETYHQQNDTSKNQYGVGLKNGIFNIMSFNNVPMEGKIGPLIFSKTIDNFMKCGWWQIHGKDQIVRTCHENVNENDFNVFPKLKNIKHGTLIYIPNIKNNWRINTDKRMKILKEFLGIRYNNYLINGANIEITSNTLDLKTDVSPISYLDINNVYNLNINDDYVKDLLIDEYNNWKKTSSIKNELLENIWQKILNGGQLIFDYILNIKDKQCPIKLSILKKPNKKIAGMSIIHENRFIKHPNNNDEECISNPYKWTHNMDKSHLLWLYGELDIKNIPGNEKYELIKPDSAKVKLIFNGDSNNGPNSISTADFNDALKDVAKDLEPIVDAFFNVQNKIEENKKNQERKKTNEVSRYIQTDGTTFIINNNQADPFLSSTIFKGKSDLPKIKINIDTENTNSDRVIVGDKYNEEFTLYLGHKCLNLDESMRKKLVENKNIISLLMFYHIYGEENNLCFQDLFAANPYITTNKKD